jgi:multicomponent Na+:H+ antiporter subunit C
VERVFAIVVGGLYAAGIFLMLRRNIVKLIIGLALLSHGANLLIFTAGGLTRSQAPLVPEGQHSLMLETADPVPQALILTAIVISFGVLAFMLVLVNRTHQEVKTDDIDVMRSTDS